MSRSSVKPRGRGWLSVLGKGHNMSQKHRLLRRRHTWVSVLLTQSLPLPQTLSHSLKMADQNLEKLKLESERLEQHAQKSVNWLLWAMLIVVCFVFISMILFIRIMPRLK